MPFDIAGAVKEGYSKAEIASYLAQEKEFDYSGAQAEGYSDDEIIQHLSGGAPKKKVAVSSTPQVQSFTDEWLDNIQKQGALAADMVKGIPAFLGGGAAYALGAAAGPFIEPGNEDTLTKMEKVGSWGQEKVNNFFGMGKEASPWLPKGINTISPYGEVGLGYLDTIIKGAGKAGGMVNSALPALANKVFPGNETLQNWESANAAFGDFATQGALLAGPLLKGLGKKKPPAPPVEPPKIEPPKTTTGPIEFEAGLGADVLPNVFSSNRRPQMPGQELKHSTEPLSPEPQQGRYPAESEGLPFEYRAGGEIPALAEYIKQGGTPESYPHFVEFMKNSREKGMRSPMELEDQAQGKLDLQPKSEQRQPPTNMSMEMAQQRFQFDNPVDPRWTEERGIADARASLKNSQAREAAFEDGVFSQYRERSRARDRGNREEGTTPYGDEVQMLRSGASTEDLLHAAKQAIGFGKKAAENVKGYANNDSNQLSSAGASLEAISRKNAETSQGVSYYSYNPNTDHYTPLTDVGRVDARAPAGTAIMKVLPDGKKIIVENNSSFGNEGLINRFSSKLPKERGGPKDLWKPAETRDKIKSILGLGEKEVQRPTILATNLPSSARSTQPLADLVKELTVEVDGQVRRTHKPMSALQQWGTPFQTPETVQSPLRRWVLGRVEKAQLEAANLVDTLLYNPKFTGFHKFRTIQRIEHSLDGGITRLERLVKHDFAAADKLREVMETFKRVKDPTIDDLLSKGLSREQAEAGVNLNKMYQKIADMLEEAGMPIERIQGYMASMWEGPYRAWVTNKVTGEKGVISLQRDWSKMGAKLPTFGDWETTHVSRVSRNDYLSDIDLAEVVTFIDNKAAKQIVMDAIEKQRVPAGFPEHALHSQNLKGYLGSLESTPKQRAENWLRGTKKYVASAARHITKQKYLKDINEFAWNETLKKKYPIDHEQALTDWHTGMGGMYDSFQSITNFIDTKGFGAVGLSVGDVSKVLNFFGGMATRVRVLMFNPMNLFLNKLQFALASNKLIAEGAPVMGPALRGAKDYANLKTRQDLWPLVQEWEKRGVITTSYSKDFQDASLSERRASHELHTEVFEPTLGEKALQGVKEFSGETETLRTETQSRLQAALISRHAYMEMMDKAGKKYTTEDMHNWVQDVVKRGFHDYERYGKAPIFTATGVVGDAIRPVSTFAMGELNSMLENARGAVKGSAKWNHAKATAQQALMWTLMGGITGNIAIKVYDSMVEAYNSVFPDDPIKPAATSILANDNIPETIKAGVLTSASGISFQNSAAMPTSAGGLSAKTPFGIQFAIDLVNAGVSVGSDMLDIQDLTDPTLKKLEKITSPVVAGWVDNYRTERNAGVTTNKEEEGEFQRGDVDQLARLIGTRTYAEQLHINHMVHGEIMKKQVSRAISDVTAQMVSDFRDKGKGIDPEKMLVIAQIGTPKDIKTALKTVFNSVPKKMMTAQQRMLFDGLTARELQVESEVDSILPEENELGVGGSYESYSE